MRYEEPVDPEMIKGPMKFKATTTDFSVTGLREAKLGNVGDVTEECDLSIARSY